MHKKSRLKLFLELQPTKKNKNMKYFQMQKLFPGTRVFFKESFFKREISAQKRTLVGRLNTSDNYKLHRRNSCYRFKPP